MNSRTSKLVVGAGVLVLSLLLVPLQAQGAGTTLSGTIFTPLGKGVPNAKVTVVSAKYKPIRKETQTDSEGHYSIPDLEPGDYIVFVEAEGYGINTIDVTIAKGAKEQTLNTTLHNDPLKIRRGGGCPLSQPQSPVEGQDIFTPGAPPVVQAWLVQRYHWDDGQGNDLTVDLMCVANAYFSLRVTQSKNGQETLLATPGGGVGLADPGMC